MNGKKLFLLMLTAALFSAAGIFFVKTRSAPLVSPAPEPAIQIHPATQEEIEKAVAPAPEPSPPLRIGFELSEPGRLREALPLALVVESNLPGPKEKQTLDLLLRLPTGIRLESSGWKAVELPPEEQKDSSGPWFLFEKKQAQFKESIRLSVTEPGVNWIITARARLTREQESWQAFGVIFATVTGTDVEFHPAPKTPADLLKAAPLGEQRAQADRS